MTSSLVNNKTASKGLFRVLAVILVVAAIYSCAKSPNKIGSKILPENSKLQVARTDTSTVYAYSELSDSVRSDELSFNYFGSLADPYFGITNTSFYTEVSLSSIKHDFGPNPQLDSLVLFITYAGYYGDTNITLTAHAYELEELMELDQEYYSHQSFQYNPTDYLNTAFIPTPNDSTTSIDTIANDTIRTGPVARFNLSNFDPALGNKLLAADTSIMANTNNFRDYFKGLYLRTDNVDQNGCLIRFNLTDLKSGMVLYYKNDTMDSLKYSYLITSLLPRVSHYEHVYDAANEELKNQVINGDTLLGNQKFYVQGLAGIKSVIKFPYLRNWARNKKVAINEAKLVFTGFEDEPYLEQPAALLLVKRNQDLTQEVLIDQYQGGTYFGGVYNSSTKDYTFRITNHIQKLLLDTTVMDYGMYVYTNASSINPKRFIFNGNQPTNDTISLFRLEIIYTDLD